MTPFHGTLAFIEGIGGPELLMVLFIILLLFGGEKLPGLARTIGKSMSELKKASGEVEREIKRAMEESNSEEKSQTLPAPVVPPASTVSQAEHGEEKNPKEANPAGEAKP